jgi:hypothetical protein
MFGEPPKNLWADYSFYLFLTTVVNDADNRQMFDGRPQNAERRVVGPIQSIKHVSQASPAIRRHLLQNCNIRDECPQFSLSSAP